MGCSYGTSSSTSHLCRCSRSLCWIPLCCLPLPCCCRPVHCCPCPTSCSCCLPLCCSLCLRCFPHRMCQQRWIYCPMRISLRHQCKICTYQLNKGLQLSEKLSTTK